MGQAEETRALEEQRRRESDEVERRHAAEMESAKARHATELSRAEARVDQMTAEHRTLTAALRQRVEERRTEFEEQERRHGEELEMRTRQMEALKKNMADRRRSEKLDDFKKSVTDCTAEVDRLERLASQSKTTSRHRIFLTRIFFI